MFGENTCLNYYPNSEGSFFFAISCFKMSQSSKRVGKWYPNKYYQALYSLNGKTSYHPTSWRLEAARLDIIMIVSLWNFTGISAALLVNFRAIRKVMIRISWLWNFTRSYGRTGVCLMKSVPGILQLHNLDVIMERKLLLVILDTSNFNLNVRFHIFLPEENRNAT